MVTNIEINPYNSYQYIHIKDVGDAPQYVTNYQELYKALMSIDLSEYLGIPIGLMIKCILPGHKDKNPSAHIYIAEDGTQLYKCFGCDEALNIIQLTMRLANCSKITAVKFISNLYNIRILESACVKIQKREIAILCQRMYTKQFQDEFPNLHFILGDRKKYLEKMLNFISENIRDDLIVDGKPIVFASYNTLLKYFGTKKGIVAQSTLLFTFLTLIRKVPISEIPKKYLEVALEIQRKHKHCKMTNFYQLGDFGIDNLKEAEAKAIALKGKKMTLNALSREFIYRAFGQAEADRCFPQYKRENAKGTSKKSDDAVSEIASLIHKRITEQGYCLVKEITENKKYDLQYRKAAAEILDSYGWQKRKLNKELKKKLEINSKGYPAVIIKD